MDGSHVVTFKECSLARQSASGQEMIHDEQVIEQEELNLSSQRGTPLTVATGDGDNKDNKLNQLEDLVLDLGRQFRSSVQSLKSDMRATLTDFENKLEMVRNKIDGSRGKISKEQSDQARVTFRASQVDMSP